MKIANWFNDLPFAVKISIIGLLALVSVAIPTYLYISTTNEKVEITELEILGLEPSDNALKLMKGIAVTRGLSVRFLNGENQVSSQLISAITDVNANLKALPETISPRISSNTITQYINEIQTNYTMVSSAVQNQNLTAIESFKQFNQINLTVQNLLGEIINRSQ